MAKLSRRASSSAATPSTATTATTASTGATSVSPSHQQQQQDQQQHQPEQQQRIARRAANSNSNSNSNNNNNNNSNKPQAAALIDTSPDVRHENPPPSPTPAALSNYNSNSSNNNSNSSYHSNTATPTAPAHAHVTATPYMPLLPPGEQNLTEAESAAERARIREEFFATYDVMTGVRIAATLGGFFGLMVFLIVWKSRSSSNETLKVLKDPKMAAVAAVCMQEEEEREIHDAIVATGMSLYPDEYDAMVYRRQRMLSLGNVSAPPLLNRGYRCGSMGGVGVGVPVGYSYLLEPPRRFSYSSMSGGPGSSHVGRRKSGSESSRIFSNYPMGGSFGTDDYFVETEDELEAEEYLQPGAAEEPSHQRTDSTRSKPGFLSVPMAGQDSRRSSAMTCCSTDSSYLERRTSAYMGGCMGNLPPTLQRKLSTASRTSSIDNWDYYYPDIQVIQPTPKASPCPSERSVHEGSGNGSRTSTANLSATNIKRKHSIVSYDPDSAQAGRKQQIHSISADTVDVYPYNQRSTVDLALPLPKPVQSAPPTSAHQAFHFCDSPSEELRLGVRRKLTLVELQRNESNNNSFPYTANAAVPAGPVVPSGTAVPSGAAGTAASSSSLSVDSTPVSLERLNGAGSGGSASLATVSVSNKLPLAMGNNNPEKRAPLASLSSFKISSLECPDSELRSLDEDSVFGLESPADTDDDMQQLSSDSEEQEAAAQAAAQAQTAAVRVASGGSEAKPNPVQLAMPAAKRMSLSSVPPPLAAGGGGARPRRPLLQRHRTISATSSGDRVALINQPLQLQQFHMGLPIQSEAAPPLETHFGAVVVSQSPPRRGPLLQQYSDPQTTTTTTTTTTTEEDTCSTLNTELGLVEASGAALGGGGAGGPESATHTQYSSLNTVISVGRSTPSPVPVPMPPALAPAPGPAPAHSHMTSSQQPAQLPTNAIRMAHDPCASSVSDSVIATRQQSICVPASLKDLILRKAPPAQPTGISRSATNLSCESGATGALAVTTTATPAVVLELPLIRLPNQEDQDLGQEPQKHHSEQRERARELGGEKRDPSLPGTSRKWSKETLF
ncbi:flocculation protein FLO11 [Drosophila ficusphila]|uniref:flocculation protein FLO11 n=1 Tax=Drosophila ficusphila TaxID=30025 RepID=UPI001C8952D1|nr:flocculation protein FLO11 [Drosophila ficusphila]